ncbi:MAG: four helix bundle protein [Chlorobaculum sp.]|nr:four helix bundle protein [Chlorobaculum sp.]
MADTPRIILPHGNYKELRSFRKTEIIYDLTVQFCRKNFSHRDRTVDQMVQAARSGKQNIAEGCMASGTSKEMEIKLVNVARASLEELLQDYQDYLRTRHHPIWQKNSKEALYVRKLGRSADESYETYREFIETRPANVVANIAICLIHQANYLLDRQIAALEKQFLEVGGIRERMTNARLATRQQQNKQ